MITGETIFDGVHLLVPILDDGDFLEFPHKNFDTFDTYCGPGTGLADSLVPDDIYGIKISPACYLHDVMWEMAEGTWRDFHYSNSVFFHNILRIIEHFAPPVGEEKVRHERYYRAVTYYMAVDGDVGASLFWRLKRSYV